MTDEKNESTAPPPLVPPPVRRDETGVPLAEREPSLPVGDGDPVFVEPDVTRDRGDVVPPADETLAAERHTPLTDNDTAVTGDDTAPTDNDTAAVDDNSTVADDTTDGPIGRDLIEDQPADPAYGEPRLDPAPQSVAASPIPTVDPPVLNENDGDPDRVAADPGPTASVSTDARDADARDAGERDVDASDRMAAVAADDERTARDARADASARDAQAADAETVAVAHPSTAPSAPPQPVFVPTAEGGTQETRAYPPVAASPQRQFVEPPVAPKKKGNRGVGSLIAVLSVIIFAALYFAIAALIIALISSASGYGENLTRFVTTSIFYVPAILFVVAFVIVVLLANRASWWAYVLGSLLVGAIVYFGTIGIQLLVENVVAMTPEEASQRFVLYALNPFVIAAALVAREVALWTGSAIAARGRRMKARNVTAREDYERASAEHRAEFERTGY